MKLKISSVDKDVEQTELIQIWWENSGIIYYDKSEDMHMLWSSNPRFKTYRNTCSKMFIAALFIISHIWKYSNIYQQKNRFKIVVYSDSEILHTEADRQNKREREERDWEKYRKHLILKYTIKQKKTGINSYIHTIWFHLCKMKNQSNLNYIV